LTLVKCRKNPAIGLRVPALAVVGEADFVGRRRESKRS